MLFVIKRLLTVFFDEIQDAQRALFCLDNFF